MSSLRHLLLVVVLVFAQLAAGMHAVGHAADKEGGGLPAHACELCLAAHDLGSALPSLASLSPVLALPPLLTPSVDAGRGALPPPAAVQRGPPLA